MDNIYQGFDQAVQKQIKDHLSPPQAAKRLVQQETPFGQASIPVGADVPGDSGQKKPSPKGWQKSADGDSAGYGA